MSGGVAVGVGMRFDGAGMGSVPVTVGSGESGVMVMVVRFLFVEW